MPACRIAWFACRVARLVVRRTCRCIRACCLWLWWNERLTLWLTSWVTFSVVCSTGFTMKK